MVLIVTPSDNALFHHGVDGMKWGVRNGPPYPLDKAGRKALEEQKSTIKGRSVKISTRDKAKIIKSNIDDLTDDEIRFLINRIKLEKEIDGLLSEGQKQKGESYASTLLKATGKAVAERVVPAVTLYAFKRLVAEVGGDDVVSEMFPKK